MKNKGKGLIYIVWLIVGQVKLIGAKRVIKQTGNTQGHKVKTRLEQGTRHNRQHRTQQERDKRDHRENRKGETLGDTREITRGTTQDHDRLLCGLVAMCMSFQPVSNEKLSHRLTVNPLVDEMFAGCVFYVLPDCNKVKNEVETDLEIVQLKLMTIF